MLRTLFFLGFFCFFSSCIFGQTPIVISTQVNYTFTENFDSIANWTFKTSPSADGTFSSGKGASSWKGNATQFTGIIPDAKKITTATTSFTSSTSGGVQKGSGSMVMLTTGATDSTSAIAMDFYVDFTGLNAGTISFDWGSVNNSTGDRKATLKVYTSIDGVSFTELSAAQVLNFTNNVLTSGSIANVNLPSSFNGSSTARIRFYLFNGTGGVTGSRPKISIDNFKITGNANSPCTTPSNQPSNLNFSTIGSNSVSGTFSSSSGGADNYLMVLSTTNSLSGLPSNGYLYIPGSDLGDAVVVSNDDSLTFNISSLNPSTNYYLFVFAENNLCIGGPIYNTTDPLVASFTTTSGILPCESPLNQPVALVFSNVTTRGLQGDFTASSNTNEYLVIRKTSNNLNSFPVNGTVYNPKDTLGGGTVVYSGPSTSFLEDSLSAGSTYYYFVFGLNSQNCSNGPVYNITTPLTSSVVTLSITSPCVAPSNQPTSLLLNGDNSSVSGSFTASSDADSYLVLMSSSSTLTQSPVNNTVYSVGASLGNAIVVSNSSSLSFYKNNLSSSATYYFFVFAMQNLSCSGGPKYKTISPLTQSFTTTSSSTYNFYFGNLHAHSSYSDGNKDSTAFTPANDYAYAKNSLGMDFLGISEHNHAGAGMSKNNWPLGISQANAATNSSFVALYGQEWGVISNGGHVLIYGIDSLIGWEANNYQIYVAKSDYTGPSGLFKILNRNGNAFASYAHPSNGDYNSIDAASYNVSVDSAVVGCAVESGPAFSISTTYNDNPASMGFLGYYTKMLSKGYHLGPLMDHDTHYTNFGRANENRLVVLAPSLTKANLIDAMKARRFYATEDIDTRVTFTINNQVMGSVTSGNTAPTISISVNDPTAPSGATKSIKLMYGIPGSGVTPTTLTSTTSATSLNYTHSNLSTGSTGYYYADITINGKRTITAPIWYTKTNIVSAPSIIVGSVSNFGMQLVNSQSTEKSYTISGTSLQGNISVNAPLGFLISTTTGSGFGSSLNLTPTSGTLNSTTIYVKFNPTVNKIYTGNITHLSTNATTQNVVLSGTSYVSATSCNSYSWNGTTYTTSGDKTYSTLSNGVDSTATLRLTIKYGTSSSQAASTCKSYVWNGSAYTSSGIYSYTTNNSVGCDSIATLNLTIKRSSTSSQTSNACNSYFWNGSTYTSSGIYSYTTNNSVGCDSIATLNLTIKRSSTSSQTSSACNSYVWNASTYTSSGIYSYTANNSVGCDSIATLNLTIKRLSTSSQTSSACNSYVWNGSTYTSSGIYSYTATNSGGCDSIATLNLTIKRSSTSSQTSSACNSYVWNGSTYTSSGIYSYTTNNSVGCDSIATLNLTIKRSSTSSQTSSACNSYVWNGNVYTSSGIYSYTTTNSVGCDSIATLNLTIKRSSTSSQTTNACNSYVWNGNTYTSSGTYSYTTSNSVGCDSIATLNLTIKRSSTSSQTSSACNSYVWNGNTYTSSGTYSYTTTNSVGCDSIAALNLTIKQTSLSAINAAICNYQIPYTWDGANYSTTGLYTKHYTNSVGCDSTSVLNLSVNSCSLTLNMKLFLEGFYISQGKMQSTLYDLGLVSTINETDSINVSLWSPLNLNNANPDFSFKGILHSDGSISLSIPGNAYGNDYYVAVKHRNSIEIWSALPVSFSSSVVNYDFSTGNNKAYSDGFNTPMKYMGGGVYAIYSGDINQDGGIDLSDMQIAQNDALNFAFGYNSSDCQGDGGTDLSDLQTIENNGVLFIFFARPY